MKMCPCGSQKNYNACCGLYITGANIAPSPETLMRSRYTAYTQANIEYIQKTMRGPVLLNFNATQAQSWAERVTWLGLTVVEARMESPTQGFVEFIARFLEERKIQSIHERSTFLLEDGMWFYTQGKHQSVSKVANHQNVGRNDICPCGSQKKYKFCHGV